MQNRIDLHTHTIFSDGWVSPLKLLNLANKQNISVLSITDHDSIESYKYLKEHTSDTSFERLILIPGVEFTANFENYRDLHILGYGIDFTNPEIFKIEEEIKSKQLIHKKIFQNVLKDYSLDNISTKLEKRNPLYGLKNYNFYDFLKIYNISPELYIKIKNRYKELINNLQTPATDLINVINTIHKSGGYALFAHPGHYKLEDNLLVKLTKKLIEIGIDGIEIFHPSNTTGDISILQSIANSNNLLVSAGSDFHRLNQKLSYPLDYESTNLVQKLITKMICEEKTFNL